jgi:DNA-directed RNA polymerase subunit alpha
MVQVQCIQTRTDKATELFSQYSIGPFTKGQSTTVGNSLRRALLSNLQGLAVVGARITGVNHEFSTIPNVKEDVMDILLNLKQLVIKGEINEPVVARILAKGPGMVCASDIELPENTVVVEPRQYITNLYGANTLEMELLIEKGRGYTLSEKNDSSVPEGFLSVDAVFMPVKKVNFFIETSQNNASSELENLILEIWTDGSVTPAQALSYAAEELESTFGSLKLTKTASPIQTSVETTLEEEGEETGNLWENKWWLERVFIEQLELSVRAYNCLKRANIHTLYDLSKYSAEDLLEFKNFG